MKKGALCASLAGALGLALAGSAHANTVGGQPSGPEAGGSTYFPPTTDGPMTARVVLRCRVKADATVERCVVVSEAPPGHGLGEVAVRMSAEIKIHADTFKPSMVGSEVEIPIRFTPENPPADDARRAGGGP